MLRTTGRLRAHKPPLLPAPNVDVAIKRIYEDPQATDGVRMLVDRIWPRGVSKQSAALDGWPKDLAPSTALRQWFGHDPARWTEFRRRYDAELRLRTPAVESLRRLATTSRVTLLYAARATAHNHARVLRDFILRA